MHSPHQPLFSAIHRVQTLEKGDFTKVNGIGGLIKPKEISTLFLDLEYDTGKLHSLTFEQYYYFPVAPKLLIGPQKWARDRGEDDTTIRT